MSDLAYNHRDEQADEAQLREALRALRSMLMKCEKAHEHMRPGSAQDTLLTRREMALRIACRLIKKELDDQQR